jgi:hypothetical protein
MIPDINIFIEPAFSSKFETINIHDMGSDYLTTNRAIVIKLRLGISGSS